MKVKGTILKQENSGEQCASVLTVRIEPETSPPSEPTESLPSEMPKEQRRAKHRANREAYQEKLERYRQDWRDVVRKPDGSSALVGKELHLNFGATSKKKA